MYRLTNIKIRENLSENEVIDIPIKKSIKDGHKKNVVILTRDSWNNR